MTAPGTLDGAAVTRFLSALDLLDGPLGVLEQNDDSVRFWLVESVDLPDFAEAGYLHVSGVEAEHEAQAFALLVNGAQPCRGGTVQPCELTVSGTVHGLDHPRPGLHVDQLQARFDDASAAVDWLAELGWLVIFDSVEMHGCARSGDWHTVAAVRWSA